MVLGLICQSYVMKICVDDSLPSSQRAVAVKLGVAVDAVIGAVAGLLVDGGGSRLIFSDFWASFRRKLRKGEIEAAKKLFKIYAMIHLIPNTEDLLKDQSKYKNFLFQTKKVNKF